ncbi:MAG: hypothetical protein ACREHD_12775 [Pirellulales bacterium]
MTDFVSPPTAVHPAAELFPMLEAAELTTLANDIAANGLLEPLVVWDGLLLDGRNRRRACEMAGVELRYVEWHGEGGSPVAFIAARNLHRRHLSESQRAAIAARVKPMFEQEAAERQRFRQFGSARKSPCGAGVPPASAGARETPRPRRENQSLLGESIEKPREFTVCADLHTPRGVNARAAGVFNISTRLVALASRVIKEGDPLLIDAIHAGNVTVSDAAGVLTFSKEEQRAAAEAVLSGKARTLRTAAKKLRAERDAASGGVPGLPHFDEEERRSPKRVRRVAKCFQAQCDVLLRYLDVAAAVCGGPNDYTRRMRQHVEALQRTMHDCSNDFGRAVRPTPA